MIEFLGPDIGPYTVHNVFTPTQPAKLTFIDRDIVNNDLIDALETPGTQVVVYGHTGSGKTTLLTNKLEQVKGLTGTTLTLPSPASGRGIHTLNLQATPNAPFRRPNGIVVEGSEPHGCGERLKGPWMALVSRPLEQ